MVIVLVTSAATLLILAGFLQDYFRLRMMPWLPRPRASDEAGPLVSVIIPARNEARNIARCLDGVLAQRYRTYEVIVVDDASTDATPRILADYAARYPQVRVLQGRPLPPGWTGKCNACQQAAMAARGEWLLFLDADTLAQPSLIAALLAYARRQGFDLLTIFPFVELGSFWERVILPPFLALITAVFPIERLLHPQARPDEMIANGQCILVRAQAYAAIGGHGAVAGAVLEDVQLAQALRAAGFRIGGAAGMEDLRVRMYTNGREVIEGLTKNASAGYRRSGGRASWIMMRLLILALGPFWLLGGGGALVLMRGDVLAWAVLAHGVVVVVVALSFWRLLLQRLYALPWFYTFLWPFGLLCYGAIALRGMWQVRRGRGVVWKGRVYVGE